MTDTDFDLDDEPVLTAEGEVAAAICGHQVVMQRGDALTAGTGDPDEATFQAPLPGPESRVGHQVWACQGLPRSAAWPDPAPLPP